MTRPAPIIAAVLLLLPVLYVGSYLVLRRPSYSIERYGHANLDEVHVHYKFCGHWGNGFYWPLEQIDRRLRPKAWEPTWKLGGSGGVRSMKSAYGLGQNPAP